MDGRPIVDRPLHDSCEFEIEALRLIDEVVHKSGFEPRTRVNQEMQRAVVVRRDGIEKMVPAAEIAEPALVRAKLISQLIPTVVIEILR